MSTVQMKTCEFLPQVLHGENNIINRSALDTYISQEIQSTISQYGDRFDKFRLHWIAHEMIKDCQPHILNMMSVKEFVVKMMDLYVLGSYASVPSP